MIKACCVLGRKVLGLVGCGGGSRLARLVLTAHDVRIEAARLGGKFLILPRNCYTMKVQFKVANEASLAILKDRLKWTH